MTEKSSEKTEFEFPPHKVYKGVPYELGELTPNGTAFYISITNPSNKEDWPTCIEVDQNGDVIWDNLSK